MEANKHRKRLLVIRKVKIAVIVRCPYTPVRVAKMKKKKEKERKTNLKLAISSADKDAHTLLMGL